MQCEPPQRYCAHDDRNLSPLKRQRIQPERADIATLCGGLRVRYWIGFVQRKKLAEQQDRSEKGKCRAESTYYLSDDHVDVGQFVQNALVQGGLEPMENSAAARAAEHDMSNPIFAREGDQGGGHGFMFE